MEVNTIHCESYAFAEVDAQLLHERKFTSLATQNVVHVWAKFLQNIHIPVCNGCKEVALFLFNFHHNCTTFLPTREASEAELFSSLLSVHIVPPTSVQRWVLALIFMMMNLPANHNFPRVATCFCDCEASIIQCYIVLELYWYAYQSCEIIITDYAKYQYCPGNGLCIVYSRTLWFFFPHTVLQRSGGREREPVCQVSHKSLHYGGSIEHRTEAGLPPLSLSKIPPMCPGIRLCMVQGV